MHHRLRISVLLLFSGLLAGPAGSWAAEPWHPYHLSRAEVAWNSESGKFEVALCVWPVDLESALSQQEQRSIDLQREPELEPLVEKYLRPRFQLRPVRDAADAGAPDAGAEEAAQPETLGTPSRLRWVGMEPGLKQVWLYFELEGDPAVSDWRLENRVFFELNDDQLNHVQWSLGKRYETFVCQPREPRHAVSTTRILRSKETIQNGLVRPGAIIGNRP